MPSVTGRISASFTDVDGTTRLGDRFHSYPLKIAKAFPFDEGQQGVYVMDASPGIMSGDAYELAWRFGENTKVFITNQSYTKVHPMLRDAYGHYSDVPSQQTQKLQLLRGSYVEYLPEPLMLYKDASFSSHTEVRMEKDSTLLMSEIICPGRTHRGELFQYQQFKNEISVVYEDEWIYCAKQRIEPSSQRLQSIGGWGDFTHYGTLYVFSERTDAAFADSLRDYLDEINGAESLSVGGSTLFYGVSRTYKYGVIVSVMGSKVYELQDFLEKAWKFARGRLFSRNPFILRK
ncbi:urease accessory protein UreD [Paenibacillus sp. UNC451MF]|uniref:urease accessory protein UreD n=1 Tax=Paenibacillus sp. UNC451MF TaxID=1449063 RepID=UPI00048B5401|nr:urease accessory protein UreD [Paenibacillus sp. UNC451MF]